MLKLGQGHMKNEQCYPFIKLQFSSYYFENVKCPLQRTDDYDKLKLNYEEKIKMCPCVSYECPSLSLFIFKIFDI